MMHFACSRCGHRQEVDASCASHHPTGASVRVSLRGGSVAVNDGNAPFFAAALAGLGALAATTTVLELTRGRRRRFPYLDEYDP